MTRTISLIIGIAVVALVAVPTALGEGRLAGSSEPDGVAYFYANERATLQSNTNQPPIVSENTPEPSWVRAERLRSEGLNRMHGLGTFAVSTYKDANERVVQPQSEKALQARSEGLNRMHGLGTYAVSTYKDANERVVQPQSEKALQARSEGMNRLYQLGEFATGVDYKDAHERVDLPTAPVSAPVASSGRDVEWPQIGIGFGIGIALAIVLGLSLKATRPRTLAH